MPKKRRLADRFREPAGWQWGSFVNARGAKLRTGSLMPEGRPKAHIVYVEGLSDFAEKNFELARTFNQHSCAFHIFDRQGQGMSGRMLKDKFKQHSTGFHHDVRDVLQFVREAVPRDGAPVILFGHSTGGMIALMALHDAPEGTLAAGSLTAPLLGMLNPAAKDKEKYWAKVPMPAAVRQRYIPGGNAIWARNHPRHHYKQKDYTSDPERMKVSDYWQRLRKDLRAGSPTMGWAKSVCDSIVKIRKPAYLRDIKVPVAVFTAGQDILVNNRYVLEAVNHLPDASYVHFKKGKHDLPTETDDIRDRIIRDTLDLLNRIPKP